MAAIANIVLGPVIVGLIFGFVVGTRIHMKMENSFKFTASAIIALVVGVILMAWNLGQYPTYNDLPIATTFLAAIIGILLGSALLGGRAKGDH